MATVVSADTPYLLTAGLKKVFKSEYQREIDDEWKKICMEMPSTGASETYAWLGATPAMREWLDERKPSGLQEQGFSVTNKSFESTIAVDRDAIEDDRYAEIAQKVKEMAETARAYYGERCFTKLAEGDTSTYGLCYDGNEFFDTAHKEGKDYRTNQSNLGTGALTADNLSAAKTAMRKFRDDRGNILNIIPDTMIVPPDLEDTATKLLKSATSDASGNVNVHKGQYNLIVTPYITDEDSWILACCNRTSKPMIFQNRKATSFESLEGDSEQGFMRKKYHYGVDNRFEFAYGNWRYAYMSVPA